MLIVGSVGLFINIIGLALFHGGFLIIYLIIWGQELINILFSSLTEHGHGHSHGGGSSHGEFNIIFWGLELLINTLSMQATVIREDHTATATRVDQITAIRTLRQQQQQL